MTRFKGIPLFGKDSSPQNTSEKLGLIGTAALWFLILIVMAFIKPAEKKPKYKEVQIVLSSTPVEKHSEEAPAPAAPAPAPSSANEAMAEAPAESAPAPIVEAPAVTAAKPVEKAVEKPAAKPVEKKAASKPVEKPAETKPAAKTEPVKQNTAAVKKIEPVALSKSVEELMAEQFANKKSKNAADYDPFAQFEDEEFETTEAVVKTVANNTPAFSGSAATSAETSNQPVKSASTTAKNVNKTASSSTSSALGKISNTKFLGTASSSVDTEATVQTTASGNGKVAMAMDNGSSRILLEPAKPIINLSEAAAATIDGSRKVSIKFTVTESGNVPRGEITIEPESILAEIVRKEIRDQISKWRFESADYISRATFEYKIVKYND